MLLRAIFIGPVLLLAACSTQSSGYKKPAKPVIKYEQNSSRIVPVNSIESSNNPCIDHFNFLRQAKDSKYQDFSRQYINVSEGFAFLRTNKNIMDASAREVYDMNLNMKLETLCTKVNYAGFQVIRQKLKELSSI
jgi:hypothetical protein